VFVDGDESRKNLDSKIQFDLKKTVLSFKATTVKM
jgi:hypothetical protein